ncbi:MAG TPA: hypothetical protein PKM09_06775 [Bacillota bacterium]|nr:hypothetical protein [Bacillota bacterium]HOI36552.1 hypothetical protein [Bacillota bacterium]HPU75188.1 hypothetical protein [Bacillota bacterium]
MTGGDDVGGREDLQDILMECFEQMMWVDKKWPGADDEERMEMRSLLMHIGLQLQPVIEARDVPWGAFRQAMDLMEHAAHNLNLLCTAEYARKLSRLEQELRAATTDEGWDVYLEIDTLRSDEAARRAAQRRPRRACCCSQRNQFMTSRSS